MSSKPKFRTIDRERNRSLRKRAWFDERATAPTPGADRANAPKAAAGRPSYRLAMTHGARS